MSRSLAKFGGEDDDLPDCGQESATSLAPFFVPTFYTQAKKLDHELSFATEKDLIAQAKLGDEGALESLVIAHLHHIIYIAKDFQRKSMGSAQFTLVDLVDEGVVGLVCAIHKFDPGRGRRLITSAGESISDCIRLYVFENNGEIKVSARHQASYRKMQHLAVELRESLGRQPNDLEIEAAYGEWALAERFKKLKIKIRADLESSLGSSPDDVAVQAAFSAEITKNPALMVPPRVGVHLKDLRAVLQPVLRVDTKRDTVSSPVDVLLVNPGPDPLTTLLEKMCGLGSIVATCLETSSSVLTLREKRMLAMRFGLELADGFNHECQEYTFEEIGQDFGISRARAHQVITHALAKMKKDFASCGVTQFADIFGVVEECV